MCCINCEGEYWGRLVTPIHKDNLLKYLPPAYEVLPIMQRYG